MFVPSIYQADTERWAARIVDSHPLALLVSGGLPVPHATHVPVIRPEAADALSGTVLLTHMNRANPHWDALADDVTAKLVFSGPHGYVTPAVYLAEPAVPTWNFVAVHLTGTVRLSHEADDVLDVVRRTARRLEGRFGMGHDIDRAADHHARIVPAVGAIRFRVTAVEGMFKLSQEKDAAIRGRVADWFAASGKGTHAELARLMREFPDGQEVPG